MARILRRYYDHVDHFLCLSAFQRDMLIKEGLPADRVSILANPMLFSSETISGKGSRGYVAYIGRISPEKDVLTLIEAARRLGDLPFKFAGSYHRMPEVIKQKPDNCEFLGQLDAEEIFSSIIMPEWWFMQRDVMRDFLLFFWRRCLTVYQWFVPASAVCRRLLMMENGCLYKPGNVDELTDRIRAVWQNSALCQKLGEAGRWKVRENYAAEGLLDRLLGIYEKVIAEVR